MEEDRAIKCLFQGRRLEEVEDGFILFNDAIGQKPLFKLIWKKAPYTDKAIQEQIEMAMEQVWERNFEYFEINVDEVYEDMRRDGMEDWW